MTQDLKQLIRLQSIDLAIQELRTRIDRFPGISKALDEQLRSAQAGLESVKEKAKNNQGSRKKFEAEIASIESKISKYRDQMMSVKTNEEYRALQHEIEHAQTLIRKIEDDILTLMMEAESSQTEIKAAEARLKEDQQKVDHDRKQLTEVNQKDLSALESYLK
jgi:predicted  nucleic acid-binding Zn-ribbon protein